MMNDKTGTGSDEATWDSFGDEGPSLQDDAFFRARFALPNVGYGALSEDKAPTTPNTTDGNSDTSDTNALSKKKHTDGDSESTGIDPNGVSVQPTVDEESEPHRASPSPLADSAHPPPVPASSSIPANSAGTKSSVVNPRRTAVPPAGDHISSSGTELDMAALSEAMVLVALAANEEMKERAEQEQRKEPKPIALVNAETFPEAVEAAFNAPAPTHSPPPHPSSNRMNTTPSQASKPGLAVSAPAEDGGFSDVDTEWFAD